AALRARRRLRPCRRLRRRPRRRACSGQRAGLRARRDQGVLPRRRTDGAVLLRAGPGRLQDRGSAAPRPLSLSAREHSDQGAKEMSKRIRARREFLKTAGRVAAAVTVIAGTPTILASNRAWAMSLKTIGADDAAVLLRMTRVLYPHDQLGDIYYATVVEA